MAAALRRARVYFLSRSAHSQRKRFRRWGTSSWVRSNDPRVHTTRARTLVRILAPLMLDELC